MSSSTLDSVWATPLDRKKADEGLPATQYTAALRVNKDLHPETSSSSPSSSPPPPPPSQATPPTSTHSSTPSQPPLSTLDSRWATPYDAYKAERGMTATKYSESLATGQNDLHRRAKQQPSVRWGDHGTQVLQNAQGWRSPSNSESSRYVRENYNSSRGGGSSSNSNSPYDRSQRRSWNTQQVRSRALYSPSQSRTGENYPPQSHQQQLQKQPPVQQYEPVSARPWNMIAMKNKQSTPSSSSTTTANNDDPTRSTSSQYNQEASSDQNTTTAADTPLQCKSYKEWTDEIRQKLEKYADWKEGNDFIKSYSSSCEAGDDNGWSEQEPHIYQDNDTTTSVTYDNNFVSPSTSWNTSSQQPVGSDDRDNTISTCNGTNTTSSSNNNTSWSTTTTTTTTTNQSTWNPEAHKPWDDNGGELTSQQPSRQQGAQSYRDHTRESSVNSNRQYDNNEVSAPPPLSRSSSWNPKEAQKTWGEPASQQAIQNSNPANIDTTSGTSGIRSPNGSGSAAGNYPRSTEKPMYGALVRQHSSPGSSSPSDSYSGGASPQWQQFKQDRR